MSNFVTMIAAIVVLTGVVTLLAVVVAVWWALLRVAIRMNLAYSAIPGAGARFRESFKVPEQIGGSSK